MYREMFDKIIRQERRFVYSWTSLLTTAHPFYAIAIARAAATRPQAPLATTRPAPEDGDDPDDPLPEAAVAVAAGVAVRTAPTPPVLGPLSGTCRLTSHQYDRAVYQ